MPSNQKVGRKEIYEKIFKGEHISPEDMFTNPGFRGLKIMPYPKHVKSMIDNLTREDRRQKRISKSQCPSPYKYYMGHEVKSIKKGGGISTRHSQHYDTSVFKNRNLSQVQN